MRTRRIALFLLVIGVLAPVFVSLTGCGNKGPLFLPEPEKQQTDQGEQNKKQSKKAQQ
ncbi:MAG: lipoprotein [Acidiferrobacterales bacterium]